MRGSNQLSLEQPQNKAGEFGGHFLLLATVLNGHAFLIHRVCSVDNGQGGQLGSSGINVAYDFRCVHLHSFIFTSLTIA